MKRFVAISVALLQVLVLGCVLGSCTDPAVVDGQREIAGELRALRTALLENSAKNGSRAPARAFDRAGLTAAMEPMREVMMALVRDMDMLQTRQTALTEELKRWSQLLAQSTTAGNREEVSSLVTRLQQLEAQMKLQDTRHREVEGLLSKALDSTADRLENFLERLEGIRPSGPDRKPDGQPEGQPEVVPASNSAATDPAKAGGGNEPSASGDPNRRIGAVRRASARKISPWWFGIAGVALLAGGVFVLWLGRENSAAVARTTTVAAAPETDDGVQELWAAAALLGEAVGRLRENGDEGDALPVMTEPGAIVEVEEVDHDDFFVLDEGPVELPEPTVAMAAAPPALRESRPTPEPTPAPAPDATVTGPAQLVVRVVVTDVSRSIERVLAVLEGDPRVLRRPEPSVTVSRGGLEVVFAVLPQLAMGERAHLELLVRDAMV